MGTIPLEDAFYSAKRSYERGQYHIQDFDTRLAEFFNTEPWLAVTEIDTDRKQFHKFRWTKKPPEALESIATDAAYNFRAALDQCGYTAAVLSGRTTPHTPTSRLGIMVGKASPFPASPGDGTCRLKSSRFFDRSSHTLEGTMPSTH